MSVDFSQVKKIVLAVAKLSHAEREEYLRDNCGEDQALRAEVDDLLARQDRELGLTELVGRAVSSGVLPPPIDLPDQIGAYRILGQLGEGGMGVVYRALQENPEREVAVKLLGRGLSTEETRRRFELEAQVLGRLQHPGIAQIIESGFVEVGSSVQPFFAMELVDGSLLTTHAEDHNLGLRDRLDLMIRICGAVQHAHQRGIIHRDLKPANVLVNASGQPKVLDFGVARVVDPDGTHTTGQTREGVVVGTLAYMSPEQVSGAPFGVDTRSDVYSLGVLCYELLTGELPRDLQDLSLAEAARRIAHESPRKLRSTGRRFDPDLETIVGTALEKDPDRRYESASALATDLRHFLADEPIAARRPTVFYQIRKLVARNGMASGFAAAFVMALLVFGVAMAIQAGVIRAERDRARDEALVATQVSDFLGELFRLPDPRQSPGRTVTAQEILDRASGRIDDELPGSPGVQGRLLLIMGESYAGLGIYDRSLELLGSALDAESRVPGGDDELRLGTLRSTAIVHRNLSQYEEGLELAQEALAEGIDALGPEHIDVGRAWMVAGQLLRDLGRYEEAGKHLGAALEIASGPGLDRVTLRGQALYHTAWLRHLEADDEAARKIYDEVCPLIESSLGKDHPHLAWCLNDLSVVLGYLGDLDAAIVAIAGSVAIWERVLPEDNLGLAVAIDNLGSAYWRARDLDAAAAQYTRALEMRRRVLGPDHVDVAASLVNVASLKAVSGRRRDALLDLALVEPIYRTELGETSPRFLKIRINQASYHFGLGEFEESLRLSEEVARTQEQNLGPESPLLVLPLRQQGECLNLLGRHEEALEIFERCRRIVEKDKGPGFHWIARLLLDMAKAREALGEFPEAEKLAMQATTLLEAADRTRDPFYGESLRIRSRLARRQQEFAHADDLLALAAVAWEEAGKPEWVLYCQAVDAAHAGRKEESLELLEQAFGLGVKWFLADEKVELAPLRGNPRLARLLSPPE